ncbi:nucleotidyltransferase domain-containing protein [Bacillus infantis]|uniref:nucleotidyltransferase domain-containing protein n=1 Tax=Bacillus infantis TaxID=324767 RepID=UPI001CD4DCA9|nr:nucleotidyltransferase domain-containing protein [Bacillus infantis]MCA1039878.1 nucleotidyltransferase domain-containing protein [Bacillus infantis]
MKEWLQDLEKKHNITIYYACEAGSRAWGTASEQSDYDVRFIYKYNEVRSYLALKPEQETIIHASPADSAGWDLFKAFSLLEKSNPSLYEWAYSPIVYIDRQGFASRLRNFIIEEYSPFKLAKHYQALMSRNLKEISGKELTSRRQKQLIHAARSCLLAGMLSKENKAVPWTDLFAGVPGAPDFAQILQCYHILVEAKASGRLLEESERAELEILLLRQKKQLDTPASAPAGKRENTREKLNQWLWELLDI